MTPPPRIKIFLAKDAPIGLIIRQGPSKCFASIRWDRSSDEFELGQWIKGQIDTRNSDLSPDGNYFIYFVQKYQLSRTANKGSWTAISRTPYLKAIALYPLGHHWGGGGFWTSENNFILYESGGEGSSHTALYECSEVKRDLQTTVDDSPYYLRQQRDGWKEIQRRYWPDLDERIDIFQKDLIHGWKLYKLGLRYELFRSKPEKKIDCTDWQWADWDSNRIVWVVKGKLFCANFTVEKLSNITELYDFNPMHYKRILAPY